MLTGGKQRLRQWWAIFQEINQFTGLRGSGVFLRSIKLGKWQGHSVAFPERQRRYFNEPLCKRKRLRLTDYLSQRTLLPPVFTGTIRNNRRVQGVREGGEHCPGPK